MIKKLLAGIMCLPVFAANAQKQAAANISPSNKETINMDTVTLNTATFGTGCFWCTEAIFQQVEGVVKVTSGYSGGQVDNPTYKQICTGTTGHAECLNILYNPSIISFDELLEIFWQVHDPTTLNRQGADVGTQYRSVVFYHNEAQMATAQKYKQELDASGAYSNPIVTTLEAFTKFYPAEDYHQNYYNDNKNSNSYCSVVIKPKVEKFQKVFKQKLKKAGTLNTGKHN
jgi:peptide-methionine (S)-S-oxide reductase